MSPWIHLCGSTAASAPTLDEKQSVSRAFDLSCAEAKVREKVQQRLLKLSDISMSGSLIKRCREKERE